MPSNTNETWGPDGRKAVVVPWTVDECKDAINAERDARIAAGMAYGGVIIQTDESSLANIAAMALAALVAKGAGAKAGDLLWTGSGSPFGWIAADNEILALDVDGMIAMGQAAQRHKAAIIFKAREIKSAIEGMTTKQRGAADLSAMWG